MAPLTLVPPADLSAIRFTVLLGIALGGLDGGARVDEEETGHGEGGKRGGYGAGVEVEAAGFGRHAYDSFGIEGFCVDRLAITCRLP